jgi:DNA/RNA-binding domain of Phe-tRNA-synthetase-like protein
MEVSVSQNVLQLFPQLSIVIVRGQVDSPRSGLEDRVNGYKESALEQLRGEFPSVEELNKHPHIGAWQEAYRKFGVKPKDHRPTHEALARRLLKQGVWPKINPIVDLYLTNQTTHLLPHGGYDLEQITDAINLEIATQPQVFEPLGGGQEMTNPKEIIYRDGARVLTRCWNYRDCHTTRITDRTNSFLLFIESPGSLISSDVVQKAAIDLIKRYQSCYSGSFAYWVIDAKKPKVSEGEAILV